MMSTRVMCHKTQCVALTNMAYLQPILVSAVLSEMPSWVLRQILSVPSLRKIYDEGGVEGLAMSPCLC